MTKTERETPFYVAEKDDDFEFIDLSVSGRGFASIDEYHISLHQGDKGNYIRLNTILSKALEDAELENLRLRRDTITNDIHLVFTKYPTSGSAQLRMRAGCRGYTINNKTLVKFLADNLRITNETQTIRVSKNLSGRPDMVTIKIIKE